MELKEMIEIMKHYENGGVVEYSHKEDNSIFGEALKKHDGNLAWNWGTYTYRIKEQKPKVTIEKWLCIDCYEDYYIREAESKYLQHDIKIKLLETYEVEL